MRHKFPMSDFQMTTLPCSIVAYTTYCVTKLELGPSALYAALALFRRLDGKVITALDPRCVQLVIFAAIDLVAKFLYRIPLHITKLQDCHNDLLTLAALHKHEINILQSVNYQVWTDGTVSDWLAAITLTCDSLISTRLKSLFSQTVNALACLAWTWDGVKDLCSKQLAVIIIQSTISLLVQAKVRNCLYLRRCLEITGVKDTLITLQQSRNFLRFITKS